jgi:uncharacterized protein (DUF983 family)
MIAEPTPCSQESLQGLYSPATLTHTRVPAAIGDDLSALKAIKMPDDLTERTGASTTQPTVQRSSPNLPLGLHRGVTRKCPACGVGQLFSGYLAVRPTCAVCLNDNEQYPSDDFAPYVTIFLVLHLLIPVLILADRSWQMSVAVEMAVAIPIFLLATVALLPFAKGGVIGVAWAFGVVRNPAAAGSE